MICMITFKVNDVRPQLVLDAGGVLIPNLGSTFWLELATVLEIQQDRLISSFKQDIREPLWTGKIGQEEFWQWLHTQCPNVEIENAQNLFYKHLKPFPSIEYLNEWVKSADIHLLSNHCEEWLSPIIEPYSQLLKSITISSAVGYCKPDPLIYEHVHSQVNRNQAIMFVDDQERNFKPAQDLGWDTLIADPEGQWIYSVNNWINK
jgi:FMN phosphatase YigB (HAD superfamily)